MLYQNFLKLKEKWKVARRKQSHIMYTGIKTRMTANFLLERMQARRQWSNISKVLKQKTNKQEDCQPRILYPAKTASINQGKLKTSSDIQKSMKGFIASKSAPQEMLKEVHFSEGKCTR